MFRSGRLVTAAAGAAFLVSVFTAATTAMAASNGTTLAASKTVDICKIDEASWRYSGEIAVWNSGAVATQGLIITDCIENKVGPGAFTQHYCQGIVPGQSPAQIPPGTTQQTALLYRYSVEGAPLSGTIRNSAQLTITNHSGSLGKPKGPNPKATYSGLIPPPFCSNDVEGGCVYTRGYWGHKPGVVWPAPYDRTAQFYFSGATWATAVEAPGAGNGYWILAPQFIAAVLNKAKGAALPSGVSSIIDQAALWFNNASHVPSICSAGGSCGIQKTWAALLDSYNNGIYPGGPSHCGDE